jgi:hypothetical protein
MSKTYINPPELFPSQQYGFSQVISTRGTTTVYMSGQVAWNARQTPGKRLPFLRTLAHRRGGH